MTTDTPIEASREQIAEGIATSDNNGLAAGGDGPGPIPITSPTHLPKGNFEIPRFFTFNQTGNIMVSSTDPDGKNMNPSSIAEFNEVAVFFAAMTKAMDSQGADLYDYEAMQQVINGSGLFVHDFEQDFSFKQSTSSTTFNTDMIAALLGIAVTDGADLLIAQQVLAGMGKFATVGKSKVSSDDKVGHLLFVCEYLMGMPLVSVQYYYTDKTTATSAWKASACVSHKSYKESIEIHRDTYLFVPPKAIEEYSKDLNQAHMDEAYGEFVAYLESLIEQAGKK